MYAVLSTGNFNETTAKFYTDHALLTTDNNITSELQLLFRFLERRQLPSETSRIKFNILYVSQFNMIDRFEKLVDKEIKKAKRGKDALIRIKLNNLEEPHMIDLLYKASKAGVRVDMIVRSICCLIPGVINQSEHITVKRIVDRYLEHTRLFIFGKDDDAVVIMGSADWMIRNLRHRIEVCTPILDPDCRRELLDYFEIQWQDNDKAVRLSSDMENQKLVEDNVDVVNAQKTIYRYLQKRA